VFFPYAESSPSRICYHVLDKNHYAGSKDVEFYGQALR
jgi:hypothetical protein